MRSALRLKRVASGEWQVASGEWRVANVFILTSVLCLLTSAFFGCAPKQPDAPQDQPLASFQTHLLQTAFDVATAIPVYPHIKDRSKMQEAVVTASLQLHQPQRAYRDLQQIGNWRRGSATADYAFYCVEQGFTSGVQHQLDLAEKISETADQDWRRDRIKVRISQTHLLLGHAGQSAQFAAGIENSESGKVEQVEAQLCSAENFDEFFGQVTNLISAGDFDLGKNSLYAMAELFGQFYDTPERRDSVEGAIRNLWNPMPLFIRIELLEKMAGFALGRNDSPKALELINDAQAITDSATWPLDYEVPASARRAALRFRAGDTERALADLTQTLEQFNQRQDEVVNIYRCETLLPVAEAFKTAGDTAMALTVYKQALEAAVLNPNSRPQAEDITALCLSMALHEVEPDAALWDRLKELQNNLGDPW